MTKRRAMVGKTYPLTAHFTKAQLTLLTHTAIEKRISLSELLRQLVDSMKDVNQKEEGQKCRNKSKE